MGLLAGQDRPQLPLAEDQHPVGDLGPGREHEPFRIGIARGLRAREPNPGTTSEGIRLAKRFAHKAINKQTIRARLFTVSRLEDDGRPVTDPGSSSYAFSFDGKDALAELAGAEYLRRGGEHFRQVVALGDGAAWIRAMAEALYPHATHIVDIYHAREHLTDLAAHLAFITPDPAQWLAGRNTELDAGNIQAIIEAASAYPLDGIKASDLERKLGYFRNNAHRMRYGDFKDLGMFIGSGAIEGAIRAIVVQRAKQSGMHWTVDGAADIIALRCQHASGRWHELWPASSTPPARLRAAI